MKSIFESNSPFIRFLNFLADLIVVNILFVITSIPVITAGAAVCSAYSVLLKRIRREDPPVVKTFFKTFKSEFKRSTLIWLVLMIITVFLSADLYIIYFILGEEYRWLQFPVLIVLYIFLSIALYIYPLLATYETGVKALLKNCVLISFGNLPTTIFFTFIILLIMKVAVSSNKAMIATGSIFLFMGFAALFYFFSVFLIRIFQKYTSEELIQKDIDDKDR
ncbi:MAG: DUF624 domain-containing protein [Lachnospiraceae bacterium]|nr:DUF624 domain-containing protein [Lachnospiraceae bacterium]